MKDLITLFTALQEIGYNLDFLSFQEGVKLKMDIEELVTKTLNK